MRNVDWNITIPTVGETQAMSLLNTTLPTIDGFNPPEDYGLMFPRAP
jgi:hypothetical protein